jgi:hypothetical protein
MPLAQPDGRQARPKADKVEPIVYPNPSNGNICIQLDYTGKPALLELTDVSGSIVLKKQLENNISIININHLLKGLYLLKILSNNSIVFDGKIILK